MVETTTPTAQTLALDVMRYAYRDADGALYSIDKDGKRIAAPAGTPELSAEYKAVADQVAAIMMVYSKVGNLGVEERSMFDQAMAKGVGAVAGITDKVKKLVGEAQEKAQIDYPGKSIVDGAAVLKDGVMAIPNTIDGVINTAGKIFDQFGGVKLTEEQAKSIGTAYASAAQVASESDHGFDFLNGLQAILTFAVTTVCGWIDYDGDVLGFNKKGMDIGLKNIPESWSTIYKDEFRDEDQKRIESEMAKLPEYGSVETKDLTFLTREEGSIKGQDKQIINIEQPDRNNPAPTMDMENAPTTPDEAKNNELENPPKGTANNVLDIVKDAAEKTVDKIKKNPAAGVAGLIVGADIAHGVARGTMSKIVGDKSAPSKNAAKFHAESNALMDKAIKTENGTLPKRFGSGTHAPNPEAAQKLFEKAAVADAKATAAAANAASREAMFGTGGKAFAESSSFFGKYDIFNRGGALFGKGLGAAASTGMSALQNSTVHSTKMLYGWDAVQGVYALFVDQDLHGFTENASQIGGGWAGAKYSAMAAARYLPGRFKMLAPVAGLVGFFGGRKAGEVTNNALLPGIENQNALPPEVASAIQEMNGVATGLQAQGVNILAIKDEMAPALRTPATTPQAQADLLLQLQQCGAIPATMPPAEQVTALQSIQKMVQLQDQLGAAATKIEENKEKRASVMDNVLKGVGAGVNVVEVNHYLKGGKILKGLLPLAGKSVGRFIPWVGNALSAGSDVVDGVQAFNKGDTKAGWHSTAKATGGLIGAIGVGAGAGALAGSPFFGLGAIPGAIIGGLAGLGGYYFGSKAGGAVADSFTGYDENAVAQPTSTVTTTTTTKPSVETDPAIAAVHNADYMKALVANTDFRGAGQRLAVGGAKVTIGAVTAPGGAPKPQTNPSVSMPA